MSEDDLMAKEEARLKRLGEKGKGNIFGGGLSAAQNRGRKLSGGSSTAPVQHSAPVYKAPAPAPAPVHRPYQPPVNRQQDPAPYHQPARYQPAQGEIVSESINPSRVFDPVEEASKEEERMMKSIGKFARPETGGGASAGYSAPASRAPATTSYQPPRGPPPSSQIRNTSAYSSYSAPTEEVVEEELALPMPTRSTSARGPSSQPSYGSNSGSKPSGFVYPQFKVQSLIATDNGMANILPVADLACLLSELSIGLKNDGKTIELRRSVTENGQPKNEAQLFNLPYQVTGSTCSASYHQDEGNGTLRIRLGKVMSGQAAKGERQLLQFRTYADPSSNSDRVQIAIDQQPDHYRFYPGAPSRFDTEFTVILNGQSLEFKSSYSVEEEEGTIKTINGTQKVQLPLIPSMDQIDVSDDSVTIWPTRTSGGPINVPEQQIHIVHG